MSIDLAALEPELVRVIGVGRFQRVESLGDAQGLRFLCPKCFAANNGPVGAHGILCWFSHRGVPDGEVPGPGRWAVVGGGIADLTLAPSILLSTGCEWHGYVTRGRVTTC